MSMKQLASPVNIMFILAGIFYLAVVALDEGSVYSIFPALCCFVSFFLAFRSKFFLSEPWRVATSVLVLILSVSQLLSDSASNSPGSLGWVASVLINGALLVLFIGVTLAILFSLVKHESDEDKEEESERKKKEKKLTYEI